MIEVENLSATTLARTFRRLRKDTRHFETLLVRDPTDFVDFQIQPSQQLDALGRDLASGNYVPQKPLLHPYPKSKGINRPTVVFDVRDALVYRFCIEQIEGELITTTRMTPNIRGGIRISPTGDASGDGYYEKFYKDWIEHNDAIREGLAERPVAASTDIASYFEGIDIPLLIDLVRSTVTGKAGVVNLLSYFLRSTKVEYEYGLNVNTGLPQEDIDCSRALAYFYLHPHDNRLVEFTVENDGDLFRFADDITILVGSEAKARRALKAVTDSLRELGLVASIEKTTIMSSEEVAEQLMYTENQALDALVGPIEEAARADTTPGNEVEQLVALYDAWKKGPESRKRAWQKILKRFYTLATLSRATFLLDELGEHLIDHPIEVQEKLPKYLMRVQHQVDVAPITAEILNYLASEENLYPSLETTLLEMFLYLDTDAIPPESQQAIGAYARGVTLGESASLSDYARGIAALLCYRFNTEAVDEIANLYLTTHAGAAIFRKYLVFVALTSQDEDIRDAVLKKARGEQDPSLNRLLGFLDNLPSASRSSPVKTYLKRNRVYFLGSDVSEEYHPVRHDVLKHLTELRAAVVPTAV